MSRNPWLAVDAATSPISHAREVRRSWERFVAAHDVASVRAPIAASWERSLDAGVDPLAEPVGRVVADPDEIADRWDGHPLGAMAPVIRECLGGVSDEGEHLVVVTDSDGVLLSVEGDPRVRRAAAETVNFTEGASWSEASVGTNAIGVAIATEHAVQVFAGEHFREAAQAWTCAAAPIRDPDTGRLLGVVDLTAG